MFPSKLLSKRSASAREHEEIPRSQHEEISNPNHKTPFCYTNRKKTLLLQEE